MPPSRGCHLSFPAVQIIVLIWGAARWLAPRPLTPAEQLITETRTLPELILRGIIRAVWIAFTLSLIIAAVNAPLVLAWQNLVSPVGVLLGPPLVLLTSVALVAGFLVLLVSPLGAWAAWPLARVTEWSLAGCDVLVHAAEQIPGGWVYAPAPSVFWLVGFYLGVAGLSLLQSLFPAMK